MTPTFRQRMREIFAHDPSQSPAWLAFKAKEAALKVSDGSRDDSSERFVAPVLVEELDDSQGDVHVVQVRPELVPQIIVQPAQVIHATEPTDTRPTERTSR